MPAILPDDVIMQEVGEVAALDRQEDFYDIPLLTAHHLEALWDWPAQRGSVMCENGKILAPYAWNELPDGSILDAQGPSGICRVLPQDARFGHYRKEWFPWLDKVEGAIPII